MSGQSICPSALPQSLQSAGRCRLHRPTGPASARSRHECAGVDRSRQPARCPGVLPEGTKVGVKPIVGYEAYIAPGSRFDKSSGNMREASYHLTLLAQNRIGFQNLMKLASAAYLEGFYFKPRIDKELLESYNEGIICLSGCVSSEFNRALLRGHGGEDELEGGDRSRRSGSTVCLAIATSSRS